ncbi:hypothetical protein L202_01442 [Cryptococcus amylolentus CBS 6039]|uniref:TLC domain-containing protein n=1 Tax=Cryptococcus amylolentus CBS 6039 TaxID=1295533 RepID=A0A1E3I3N4_9TREE|nr:hypothetical protein L202_01442 [Cryptococcus amylolentus CBS 6039]ODN83270.1 hypothetical protein L202_01442 [Cryptococcus amylolentus CBS 6039]
MDPATQSVALSAIYSPSFPMLMPVPNLMIFYLAYTTLAPHFASVRQRSYLLSAITSGAMTVASLPFAWNYMRWGLEVTYQKGKEGWMGALARAGVVFFGTYLVADLSIGYFTYRNQIGLLTGWVHHTVYIGLMVYLLNSEHSAIFMAGCVMELPTFDLAMSNLFPKSRDDLRFLVSFFVFRIAYHGTLLVDCLLPSSRESILDGSWVPTVTLSLALALHALWFKGGVTGYLKRKREIVKATADTDMIRAAADMKETVQALAEAGSDRPESPESPDDTPLLTPRTPSQIPNIFSTIPHLLLPDPTIPALPDTVFSAIPGISTHSLAKTRATLNNRKETGLEIEGAVHIYGWSEQNRGIQGTEGLDRGDLKV